MKTLRISRYFPKTHSRAGQPTHFAEKILLSMGVDYFSPAYLEKLKSMNPGKEKLCEEFFYHGLWDLTVGNQYYGTKLHSMRAGENWNEGDEFRVVIWTGVPYRSKQLVIASGERIKRAWKLKIVASNYEIARNGLHVRNKVMGAIWEKLAFNDGLDKDDLYGWLQLKTNPIFKGQILAWSDGVGYLDGEFKVKEGEE